MFMFALIAHVIACFWIIAAGLGDFDKSWIALQYGTANFDEIDRSDLYLTSFYFTITTITTVGYGDFSAKTFTEKIVCIFIMILGVIGFSYASGSFTSFIQQKVKINEQLDAKIETLDRLYKEHDFPHDLYA